MQNHIQRHWWATGLLLVLFAAPAAAMNFVIELAQADLQRRVERLFPVVHEDPLYRVELGAPRVILRSGSDRIGLNLAVAGTLLHELALSGRAELDGRLRYEPASRAFYLDDAAVTELVIDGVPAPYLGELRRVAEQAARELLATRPLYVLGQFGEATAPLGREIKSVSVRDGKLVVELAMF